MERDCTICNLHIKGNCTDEKAIYNEQGILTCRYGKAVPLKIDNKQGYDASGKKIRELPEGICPECGCIINSKKTCHHCGYSKAGCASC